MGGGNGGDAVTRIEWAAYRTAVRAERDRLAARITKAASLANRPSTPERERQAAMRAIGRLASRKLALSLTEYQPQSVRTAVTR